MLTLNNPARGISTASRTALALFAATVLIAGSATQASARRYHHYHHHFHHHHAGNGGSWRDANAAIAPSSGRTQLRGDGLVLRQ